MPLSRRLPKRGFRNPLKKIYSIINISQLHVFPEGTVIDTAMLAARKMVKGKNPAVKLLADGDISYALTLKVAAATKGARQKIESAGGSVIEERQ